jgi:DNA-binding LacI/PurR family transcriptional regulator
MIAKIKMRSNGRRLSPREARSLSTELLLKFKMDASAQGLKSGDILPGEKEICGKYRVPLSIARGLFRSLKKEGLVKSVKGKGAYLLKPIGNDDELQRNKSFLNFAIVAFLEFEHPEAQFNRASGILRFFDHRSAENQCQTRLFNLYPGFTVELEHLEAIREYRPDGILYVSNYPETSNDNIRKLRMLDIPMVACGEKTSLASNVDFDNEQISSVAIEHLIRLGHEKIAFIQIVGNSYWRSERIESVKKTMLKHGLAMKDDDIFKIDSLMVIPESVSRFVEERLKGATPRYSAIFCSGDIIAAELIRNVQRIGMNVPDDLSVVGVDNEHSLRHMDITTVPHSGEEEGRESFELLTEIIRLRPSAPVVKKIRSPLLVRRTTAQFKEKQRVA